VTRPLALVGCVALLAGVAYSWALGEPGPFGAINLALGTLALAAAGVLGLRDWRRHTAAVPRAPLVDGVLLVIALCWGAVLVERLAHASHVRFDWTFEKTYELSPATLEKVRCLTRRGPLQLTLYDDPQDPRRRTTRALLDVIAAREGVQVAQRAIADYPDDADRFAIAGSNTVVVQAGNHWETVDRPSEGALFEAFAKLCDGGHRRIYLTVGAGEGDPFSTGPTGFSGLAAALETEGYELHTLETGAIREVPEDAGVLLMIAPERRLREEALDALRRYLARGGRLVAFLEPGRESGLAEVLAEWGIRSPDELVVDPASGPVEGDAPGLDPLAFSYTQHPVTRGLRRNRMTFFRGARSFVLRKPEVEDKLKAVVYASARSWLSPDVKAAERHVEPVRPPGAREDYHPLVVTGRYRRGVHETRIVAFGDSDIASNHYLRALYNLDLVVNAVHWAAEREPDITIRPKAATVLQFPLPIQNSLRALYSVGLVVPELLLLAAGLVWLRRRGG
jgi:gliding motility-associatede transport system auxiliary component